jgi:hypothetical protein
VAPASRPKTAMIARIAQVKQLIEDFASRIGSNSALIPAVRITLPHRSVSSAMSLPKLPSETGMALVSFYGGTRVAVGFWPHRVPSTDKFFAMHRRNIQLST